MQTSKISKAASLSDARSSKPTLPSISYPPSSPSTSPLSTPHASNTPPPPHTPRSSQLAPTKQPISTTVPQPTLSLLSLVSGCLLQHLRLPSSISSSITTHLFTSSPLISHSVPYLRNTPYSHFINLSTDRPSHCLPIPTISLPYSVPNTSSLLRPQCLSLSSSSSPERPPTSALETSLPLLLKTNGTLPPSNPQTSSPFLTPTGNIPIYPVYSSANLHPSIRPAIFSNARPAFSQFAPATVFMPSRKRDMKTSFAEAKGFQDGLVAVGVVDDMFLGFCLYQGADHGLGVVPVGGDGRDACDVF
ncbi:hypothetical protein B0T14DRAFT_494286 [Immersiella caudata]|uniref:Uncharacterized protein n=1 Tax=Immersiella caudata TaxID=314043 RepID=A0AA40C2J9_9PEZI|nr:hypothetical protein B0T14DRAFT_494286 [Immersiella caudata]